MSLHLQRLRVDQLRRFRQPFELRDLDPGLNILSGPNEAGKSTLVRAIRAAFFERSRSTVVDDLRPWGDSAAAPQIELGFTLDGQSCELSKSFLSKKRCDLRVGAQSWDGVEAEDQLARLFGFDFAGRGASKAENWGIPGLLWVEQGTGQELLDPARHAQDHIRQALQAHQGQQADAGHADDRATGALTATGGDELLARFSAERAELLTGTGRPRGAYQDALGRVTECREALQATEALLATHRQQVDQLATLRAQHQADELARPWEGLQQQLQAAQDSQEAIARHAQELADAQARQAQLVQQRKLLLNQLATFERHEQDAQQRQAAWQQAQVAASEQAAALQAAQAQADERRQLSLRAREALRRAREAATREALAQALQTARAQAARLQQAWSRAEAEQVTLQALRAQAAQITLGPADLTALRQADRRCRELQLRRQAVATRLQFTLENGQALTLQGSGAPQTLSGQGEHLLIERVTLQCPGLGVLTLSPGGDELDTLARDSDQAEAELRALLQRLGVQDLAEAEARLAGRAELQAQIKLSEQALGLVAPKGLATLREALDGELARCQASEAALAKLPPAALAAPDEPGLSLPSAEAAMASADAADDDARDALARVQQTHAAALSRLQSAEREHTLAANVLAEQGRAERVAEAHQQVLLLRADADTLTERITQSQRALEAARPDIVQQDILRLERSATQMEKAHLDRGYQIQMLEHGLQQAGARGLGEQAEAQAGELLRAERRLAELARRAKALDLLCRKMEGKRQAAVARLQAPLQKHLQHYLQLLFPGARVDVGEDLTPGALWRHNAQGSLEQGQFEALSFGAREQLALVSRLAYADLLREAGRPTLIILDDALVHSDQGRLSQMKRILFDASQRHQVLLFTCHPESWRDMGVSVRALAP
ncbi:AAA family ATPase [Aquabacterium sp.]|uniref:AAA family ATPase n=1 Tax=Aquabacterium sp. TaxID=1872578 RepID=UPI0025BC7F9E|nr:AAA family ATPase [Aquabacterium sp.]